MESRYLLLSITVGIASSLIASVIQLSVSGAPETFVLTLTGALAVVCVTIIVMAVKLYEIRRLGIRRWEGSISGGTTTLDWIKKSQKSLLFLGVASSKWAKEEAELRRMFMRCANNGGCAKFLLLDPQSEACRNFETIKNVPPGSLSKRIIENSALLLKYAEQKFPVEVRYYESSPHFRIVESDNQLMAVAMYSYMSDSGDDSPQIILDGLPRAWSFYYGFSAYADRLWQNAKPVGPVISTPL